MPGFERDDHFETIESLDIGSVWESSSLGLTYIRTGEHELRLLLQRNSHESSKSRARLSLILGSGAWKIDESECMLIFQPPPCNELANERAHQLSRVFYETWQCRCGSKLNHDGFAIDDWQYLGLEKSIGILGSEGTEERWLVRVNCKSCSRPASLHPEDYELLFDEFFMTHFISSREIAYQAITATEIADMVDTSTDESLVILGSVCPHTGRRLPPNFRGTTMQLLRQNQEGYFDFWF
jgi:hypothetical protein